jgi:DNA-binding transcriptional LysR family regulator
MTLKQLEVFVAIAECGSFSKGADKAGITQSTASQHIIGLEKELGMRLFDRGRDGTLLTEAGKLFLSRSTKILSDCIGSRIAMRRFLGMDGVTLRVGASDIAGTRVLPELLSIFQNERPNVQIDLHQANSRTVIQQLVDEEIELGFISGRFEDDRLSFEQLGEDSLVCACSPELQEGSKGSLSQAQLCKVPLVVREDGSGTQKSVYEALARTWINKDSLRITARLGSSDAVRRAVVSGAGYAFIAERVITDELASGKLTTVRIPGVQITRKYFAVKREGRELSPAATEFMALVLRQWC